MNCTHVLRMETSDDKPEENEETCQPKELEKSPQTSPVNINVSAYESLHLQF